VARRAETAVIKQWGRRIPYYPNSSKVVKILTLSGRQAMTAKTSSHKTIRE